MSESQTVNPTKAEQGRRRRLRRMRFAAVLFPFLLLALGEIAIRIAGLYESPEQQPYAAKRQVMELPPGTSFFPEWNRTISLPKPNNTRRLFVLGGSSAMGFGVERPFSELLEASLAEERPEQKWEVINGGVSAYGSQRTLAIIKQACEFEPDLILVYLGHNEFLEDVFYDPKGLVGRLQQASTFARKFRVANFVRSLFPGDQRKPAPKLQRHFFGNDNFPLIRSREEKLERIGLLKSNLKQMVAECRERDVKLVLIPVVTNLLAPPGDPKHGWARNDESWPILTTKCERAISQHDFEAADRLAKELIEIDTEHATGHFLAGLSALGLGNPNRGEEELAESNRLDWRGDRACQEIQQTIISVASDHGVAFLDLRPQFAKHLSADFQQALRGRSFTMFMDHCHPTQAGHQLISDACLPVLLEQLETAPE